MNTDTAVRFEDWLTTTISDINYVIRYANIPRDQKQLLKDRVYIMQLVLDKYNEIARGSINGEQ